MFAEKHLASLLPLRLPHWRLNRVMEMLRHRPQPLRPRWKDDHPIRAYRRLLLELLAAGDDEEKLNAVKKERPAVYEAHRYHYSPECRKRQEIEARLLTRESLEEIASKLGADPKAIEYYASLFFDVRDALDHRSWVSLMIRSRMRYDEESGCSRAEAERGYVMRLFGYFGGPLVLDALMNPLGETKPPRERRGDPSLVRRGSDTNRSRHWEQRQPRPLRLQARTALQLIRLAQRQIRGRKTESGPGDDVLNKRIEATLAWFEKSGLKSSIDAWPRSGRHDRVTAVSLGYGEAGNYLNHSDYCSTRPEVW